jgi:predicted phage terminase large subunit-like protein
MTQVATTRVIRPQLGPQEQFSACPADICIYGGSVFGGKTWALAYEAARYVTVPEYAAVIFRRETTQLTGGGSIWEETKNLYPYLGGDPRESPNLDWRFPVGSQIGLRHLQYEADAKKHQGKQYSFIGFDELTHFTATQFWYMVSRLRGAAGVPKRVRATCNPDPNSFVRELIDWWIGEDGLAIAERSGVIRWMVRLDERLIWGATPDEVWQHDPQRIRRRGEEPINEDDLRPEPMSFTFIRAAAKDNKIGLTRDPEYLSRVALLPGAEAKRLLHGDWNAKDSAGDYFHRTTFPVDDKPQANIKRRVRSWDKAATTPNTDNPDPDWTRGTLLAELDDDTYLIEDMVSLRAGPADVLKLMKHTAETDGRGVMIAIPQDPGQAGLVDVDTTQKALLGYAVISWRATRDKTVYAQVWAPLAKRGRIHALRREYLPTLFGELEAFPDPKAHDDIVDSISGAFQVLTGGGFTVGYQGASTPKDTGHPLDAWSGDDDYGSRPARGSFL